MCVYTVVYGILIRRKPCPYQERFLKFLQKMCFPKFLKAEKQRKTVGTEENFAAFACEQLELIAGTDVFDDMQSF